MQFIKELNTLLHSCSAHYLTDHLSFCSPYFEVFGILEGKISFGDDCTTAREGSVVTLPPGRNALLTPEGSCTLLNFSFSPERILDILDTGTVFTETYTFTDASRLFSCMSEYALLSFENAWENDYQPPASLLPVLGELAKRLPPDTICLPAHEKMTQKQIQFLTQILQYVNETYREEISLSDAAAHFQVTPQYFANFFKKYQKQTFHQFLQSVRCQKGAVYFAYTGLDTEEIGRRVSLNQPALIQTYAETHQIERLAKIPYTALDSQLSETSAGKYLSRFAAVSSENRIPDVCPALIEADVSLHTPFKASWKNLINLGYASDFSNIQIFDQLIRTQEEIGFSYGRVCRLFDLITEYTVGKRTIYDYNRIFRLLDVMIEHNMLPFLELSNKLFRIQLNLLETVPVNLIRDSAAYFDRITELLPDFLRACINRYGQDCIDQWKFEISYTNYDFVESAENFPLMKYVRYFRRIKEIIRDYSAHCQVGGPGFNYWYSTQRLAEILSLFAANQTLPDFVTAYIYPLTSDDASAALSPDENLTIERLSALRDVTRGQYPGMEIWITEFNSNLSSRNLLNDSAYQSAFLAKTLAAAEALDIQAMGYYMLSDVPLRYVDSLDLLFGGWGLFTDKDIAKPSYHAYSLFSRLGGYLLKYREPYLLTCNSNYSFQCLFYEYEHIVPEFCRKNVSARDFNLSDTLFDPGIPRTWEVCLNNARPGTYLVKEYVISGERSNILAEWRKIGYLNLSKQNDTLALKIRSQLVPDIRTIEVNPGKPLSFRVAMGHQEVRLLQIDLNLSAKTQNKEVH